MGRGRPVWFHHRRHLNHPVASGEHIAGKGSRVLPELQDLFRKSIKRAVAGILEEVAGCDEDERLGGPVQLE